MTQNEALAIMESGVNVLLTGAAGTGKTYALNRFIRRARKRGKSVAVTATTGLAATHLNGITIHAWSGIGVHDELPRTYHTKLSKQRRELINKADILIIDEISMLHDFRLDIIDEALRLARESSLPFGGMQVILCGDFFQLPPVNRVDSRNGSFVTASRAWQDGGFAICYLTRQYRQADDDLYRDILNGIRAGQLRRSQLELLQARSKAIEDPFTPRTRLLTTNANVDAINSERLASLDEEVHEYVQETTGSKKYVEMLQRSCLAPEILQLKLGAVVMCIRNSADKRYVNGSMGEVVGFEELTDMPKVRLLNGNEVIIRPETWELMDGDKRRASISQLPLRLAWAITVHKSQGMTLDAARIDLSNAFVEGMGYVALSRVKSLDTLILDGFNGMALRTSPLARQLDQQLRQQSDEAVRQFSSHITDWKEDLPDTQPVKQSNWSDKLAKMRETYPNAYRPWKPEDDDKLIGYYKNDMSIPDICSEMGRHPGSIQKRLEKLLPEAFEPSENKS